MYFFRVLKQKLKKLGKNSATGLIQERKDVTTKKYATTWLQLAGEFQKPQIINCCLFYYEANNEFLSTLPVTIFGHYVFYLRLKCFLT